MKRNIILMVVIVLLAACGGGDTSKETKSETSTPSTSTDATSTGDITSNPDYKKGLAIEVKQDCATCHRIAEKIQGPSYREVANKYAGVDTAVDYLAKKIISGGSGVWGEIPMAPHPTLSMDEARALAKYVLLMKNVQ